MSFEDAYSFEFDYMDGEAGRRLATLSMRRRDLEPHALIVLPPGYERRIHHYSVLARAFADNGYEVLRFDLSNHLGLSDGEIAEFTMSSFEQDVRGILGWDRVLAGLPVVVVASSLSARAATRAILAGAPVAGCVMVLPVADVEYTVAVAAGGDGLKAWQEGLLTDREELYRVVDHDVKVEFVYDVFEAEWGGVEPARREIAALEVPIFALSAESDDWVRPEDVEAALGGESSWPRRLVVLEATSHDIAHNPPVMRRLMTEMLAAAGEMSGREAAAPLLPDFDEVVETVTAERQWAHDEYQHLRENESAAAATQGGAE